MSRRGSLTRLRDLAPPITASPFRRRSSLGYLELAPLAVKATAHLDRRSGVRTADLQQEIVEKRMSQNTETAAVNKFGHERLLQYEPTDSEVFLARSEELNKQSPDEITRIQSRQRPDFGDDSTSSSEEEEEEPSPFVQWASKFARRAQVPKMSRSMSSPSVPSVERMTRPNVQRALTANERRVRTLGAPPPRIQNHSELQKKDSSDLKEAVCALDCEDTWAATDYVPNPNTLEFDDQALDMDELLPSQNNAEAPWESVIEQVLDARVFTTAHYMQSEAFKLGRGLYRDSRRRLFRKSIEVQERVLDQQRVEREISNWTFAKREDKINVLTGDWDHIDDIGSLL